MTPGLCDTRHEVHDGAAGPRVGLGLTSTDLGAEGVPGRWLKNGSVVRAEGESGHRLHYLSSRALPIGR